MKSWLCFCRLLLKVHVQSGPIPLKLVLFSPLWPPWKQFDLNHRVLRGQQSWSFCRAVVAYLLGIQVCRCTLTNTKAPAHTLVRPPHPHSLKSTRTQTSIPMPHTHAHIRTHTSLSNANPRPHHIQAHQWDHWSDKVVKQKLANFIYIIYDCKNKQTPTRAHTHIRTRLHKHTHTHTPTSIMTPCNLLTSFTVNLKNFSRTTMIW